MDLIKMNTYHTKEKPFKCEWCYMTFSNTDSFTRDKTIYGKKPFACGLNYMKKLFYKK